jgi:methylenetetrahydrofolate dehydrogenase (NADP+)/methenyltetrahydrofolate cyclohydrolase
MIVDGKAIAERILEQTRLDAASLPRVPSFAAFAVAPAPATQSYLHMKARQASRAGVEMQVRELPDDISTEALIDEIRLAREDAVIVQLPLPEHIDTMRVLEAIPEGKDADVLAPAARTHGSVMHPIAASIKEILEGGGVSVAGSRAVVVGQGWLVGQPATAWLTEEGAEVATVTKESGDLKEMLPQADIVVSGAGSPGLITPDLVKEGAAVIDVGTSELGGSIAGDVAPEVSEIAGLFTPVPGGVGPVAVAFLMRNVVDLARLRNADNGVH